ncbi:MAG: transaldolase, partial [Acidimicrobiia bacterium]|nr:transaldolase [Acidimicrobiia bacterium]
MGRLHQLYEHYGQSPWLDNLRRGWLTGGEMQNWIDRGVRGMTSNPSIFAKAMTDTDDYDNELRSLIRSGSGVEEAYWKLVVGDINRALEHLTPIHESSGGEDGYVS